VVFATSSTKKIVLHCEKCWTCDGVFGNPFEGSQSYAWAQRACLIICRSICSSSL